MNTYSLSGVMKGILSVVYGLFLTAVLMSCSANESTHEHDTYTCPMHPAVTSDKPGQCPVCGMDLVRKGRPSEEIKITEELARIIQSSNEMIIASIETIKPQYKTHPVSTEAQGIITYDTRHIQSVAARISGRVEKLFLKYAFQSVSKGQPLAEIYSPELITAQRELIFMLKNDSSNDQMIQAAQERLKLLGLSDAQLRDLIRNKTVKNTFTLYSPFNGYLLANSPAASTSQTTESEMGSAMAATPAATKSNLPAALISEGGYVSAGQTLFTIAEKNAFRIEINIPSATSSSWKKGDSILIDYRNGITENTTVDFVQPFFTAGEDFIKLRVIPKKTDKLNIGQLVTARIHSAPDPSLWIPKEALLDLGNDKVVFVKERQLFNAKKVLTGTRSGGVVEIKRGLASSDEIAKDAHYLVDSESLIKPTE